MRITFQKQSKPQNFTRSYKIGANIIARHTFLIRENRGVKAHMMSQALSLEQISQITVCIDLQQQFTKLARTMYKMDVTVIMEDFTRIAKKELRQNCLYVLLCPFLHKLTI
jgi:hypothetical protein